MATTEYASLSVSEAEAAAIRRFVAHEARLADDSRYEAWEALWADDLDCLYWVPAGGDTDPERRVAYINDNRARIASRVRQWQTGDRYSAEPASRLARVVGELDVVRDTGPGEGDFFLATGSFVLVQYRDVMMYWAGVVTYRLLQRTSEWCMVMKKVELVNRDGPIPTLSFIL